jgi:hypothetical protein
MSAWKIFLNRALILSLVLLIEPLCGFAREPGPSGKIAALHTMLESLAGLALVSCILWAGFIIRRKEGLEEEMLSRNTEFLDRLIKKKTI